MKTKKLCKIENCLKPYLSRGLCKYHYHYELYRLKQQGLFNRIVRENKRIVRSNNWRLEKFEETLNNEQIEEMKRLVIKWRLQLLDGGILYYRIVNLYLTAINEEMDIEVYRSRPEKENIEFIINLFKTYLDQINISSINTLNNESK